MAQVSDNGTILPRKLTGVQLKKQKRIARAIKRAQQLALMPKIWKLPQYRHAPPPAPAPAPLSLLLPPPPDDAPQREAVGILSRSQFSRPPPILHSPSPRKYGLSKWDLTRTSLVFSFLKARQLCGRLQSARAGGAREP